MHQYLGNYDIYDNYLTGSRITVQLTHRDFLAGHRAVCDSVNIERNQIYVDRIAEKFPTRWNTDGYNANHCVCTATQDGHWVGHGHYTWDGSNSTNKTQQVQACSCVNFSSGAEQKGVEALVRFYNLYLVSNKLYAPHFAGKTSGCCLSHDIDTRTARTLPAGSDTLTAIPRFGVGKNNSYIGGTCAHYRPCVTKFITGNGKAGEPHTTNAFEGFRGWKEFSSYAQGNNNLMWYPASRSGTTSQYYPSRDNFYNQQKAIWSEWYDGVGDGGLED